MGQPPPQRPALVLLEATENSNHFWRSNGASLEPSNSKGLGARSGRWTTSGCERGAEGLGEGGTARGLVAPKRPRGLIPRPANCLAAQRPPPAAALLRAPLTPTVALSVVRRRTRATGCRLRPAPVPTPEPSPLPTSTRHLLRIRRAPLAEASCGPGVGSSLSLCPPLSKLICSPTITNKLRRKTISPCGAVRHS